MSQDALIEQCAFYFSDANLRRDRFLRKHVGANGTGSVPTSILATFNRVKQLTSDSDEVVKALRAVPGLLVSEDGRTVARSRPLPESDDSELRTIYVEGIPHNSSIESLHTLFLKCGNVAFVSLPRLPSRELKGFAFIEFEKPEDAVRAVDEMEGHTPAGSTVPLKCMHRRAWDASKKEYKKALDAGKEAAAAKLAAASAAAAAARECVAESEALRQAEAAEEELRTVVKVCGIAKGAPVKALRKEMREVFGAAAPVDYVDYGVSNSGDTTVAFVRMKTAWGALEARRILMEQGQQFFGARVFLELLKGPSLTDYLERIGKLRGDTAATRRKKREQWWQKKYGQNADLSSCASKVDEEVGHGESESNLQASDNGIGGDGCAEEPVRTKSGAVGAIACGVKRPCEAIDDVTTQDDGGRQKAARKAES